MILRWLLERHRPTRLEGARAEAEARKGLEATKTRDSEVKAVSKSLREHREQDHFAEMLEESMHVAPDVPNPRFHARHRRLRRGRKA